MLFCPVFAVFFCAMCQLFGNAQNPVDIGGSGCHNVNSSLNDSVKFYNFPILNTKKGENR